jgi:hypothetical protein
MRGGRAMAVKVRLNSREFLLSWDEFERAFYSVIGCVEIVDIYHSQAGNC